MFVSIGDIWRFLERHVSGTQRQSFKSQTCTLHGVIMHLPGCRSTQHFFLRWKSQADTTESLYDLLARCSPSWNPCRSNPDYSNQSPCLFLRQSNVIVEGHGRENLQATSESYDTNSRGVKSYRTSTTAQKVGLNMTFLYWILGQSTSLSTPYYRCGNCFACITSTGHCNCT